MKLIESINVHAISYLCFALLRILCAIVPAPGYVHPDEYFQSIEIMIGDVFEVEHVRSWEFNQESPIRSAGILYLLYGAPMFAIKYLFPSPTPRLLTASLKLVCCLLSFFVDFAVYKMCTLLGLDVLFHLKIVASTIVMMVFATRTFSNTIEMVLLSLLLYLVADAMHSSDQALKMYNISKKKELSTENAESRERLKMENNYSLKHCYSIAIIVVTGVFNRPTFILFSFAPVLFWLVRGIRGNIFTSKDVHGRLLSLVIAAIPLCALFIVFDSVYYRSIMFDHFTTIWDFTFTPYNFFLYNSDPKNLEEHGLHPRYWHLLINVPLLFGVFGIFQIYDFIKATLLILNQQWDQLPELNSIRSMLCASVVTSLGALSFFPHQELRFLIPLTVPVILLQSSTLISDSNNAFSKFLAKHKAQILGLWMAFNLIVSLFFSMVHQAGIFMMAEDLYSEYHTSLIPPKRYNVITSHTYPFPKSLLMIPTSDYGRCDNRNSITVYDTQSSEFERVKDAIKFIRDVEKSHYDVDVRILLILPTVLTNSFHNAMVDIPVEFYTEKIYYPHWSMEVFHTISMDNVKIRFDSRTLANFDSYFDYLGLSLIRIVPLY